MGRDRKYQIVLIPEAEGGYVASVPELPGVVTEGDTRAEALAMAHDAIEGDLATMYELGWSVPPGSGERGADGG